MRGLFIGIGGTGDEILTHLKDKVYSSQGNISETLQFRLFDTEAEEYRKNSSTRLGGEEIGNTIGRNEYVQLKDHPPGSFLAKVKESTQNPQTNPAISNWCQSDHFLQNLTDADFNLVRGAGQHRQFARMGVFLNKDRIVNSLRHALEKCCSDGRGGEIPVWIIGSVAGGTGAGLFMDLAILSRWLGHEMRIHIRLIGCAILPDVYRDVTIDLARAHSVLRELERFQAPVETIDAGRKTIDGKSQDFLFSVQYDANTTLDLTAKLFDNLIFYNRVCTTDIDRKSYFSEIADGLNLLLDDSAGDELFRQWINTVEGRAASFNTFRVFIPARLYARQFALESVLTVAVEGLMPRDPNTQVLLFGSEDDRIDDANHIFEKELYQVFQQLLAPKNDDDFSDLSKEMSSYYIVDNMLGFANPTSTLGQNVGDHVKLKAGQLYKKIFEQIDNCLTTKETFEESRDRVINEARQRRSRYWGDGEGSFRAALVEIQNLVQAKAKASVDDSLRKYLANKKLRNQALGKTLRVINQMRTIVTQIKDNLKRLTDGDTAMMRSLEDSETNSLAELTGCSKRFMSWRGPLAIKQDQYLKACHEVDHAKQRAALSLFIGELLDITDQHLNYWLDGMQHWRKEIDFIASLANNEISEIQQRLERQTKIKSAALGLNNTIDMNGYRDYLKQQCLKNSETGLSSIDELLDSLTWKPGDRPENLVIGGWPEVGQIGARDIAKRLTVYLADNIEQRMQGFEGMAAYLGWLRDVKRDDVRTLAANMANVAKNFIDEKLTSDTRRVLFLHGDTWRPDLGDNAFVSVYNALQGDTNFSGRTITHNLAGAEGINLFKDRNIMAILVSDCEIPYTSIPIIRSMREAYIHTRAITQPEWRSFCYHLYRCDQEAWQLERERVLSTGATNFPMLPGRFSRLLDNPHRVTLFAKALATGVIKQVPSPTREGEIWVIGEKDGKADNWVYLNDPTDNRDKGQLIRAFITFMLDKKDRRVTIRHTLEDRQVSVWIKNVLEEEDLLLKDAIKAFVDSHPQYFAIESIEVNAPIDANGFLILVLHHYLKDFQ